MSWRACTAIIIFIIILWSNEDEDQQQRCWMSILCSVYSVRSHLQEHVHKSLNSTGITHIIVLFSQSITRLIFKSSSFHFFNSTSFFITVTTTYFSDFTATTIRIFWSTSLSNVWPLPQNNHIKNVESRW